MLDDAQHSLDEEQRQDAVSARLGVAICAFLPTPSTFSPPPDHIVTPSVDSIPSRKEYRRKHKDNWQREKSEQIAGPTRAELDKYRTIVQNASNADRTVAGKFDAIRRTCLTCVLLFFTGVLRK